MQREKTAIVEGRHLRTVLLYCREESREKILRLRRRAGLPRPRPGLWCQWEESEGTAIVVMVDQRLTGWCVLCNGPSGAAEAEARIRRDADGPARCLAIQTISAILQARKG